MMKGLRHPSLVTRIAMMIGIAGAAAVVFGTQASVASSDALTVRDRAGDTKASDLDILSASVSVGARDVNVRFTLASAVRGDAIYSATFDCSRGLWQLAAKRAAGTTTFFLYGLTTYRQTEARGTMSGRTVTVSGSSSKMGCNKGRVKLSLTAEGTNGRPTLTDKVPNSGEVAYRR